MNKPEPTDMVPIAITGAAWLTPYGDELDGVDQALRKARPRPAPSPELAGAGLLEIEGFDASRYATVRGMRVYNRTTQLAICAAKLALDHSQIDASSLNAEDLGLVAASTFGHLDTLIEYDRGLVTQGLFRTNPALMPLALASSPGAAAALALQAKAFSITVSDGECSSLDALALAARLLADGRAQAAIVVSAFSVPKELAMSAARADTLARVEEYRVLDQRARGMLFCEAAAALVLERGDRARTRNASVLGFIAGHGASLAADTDIEQALERACERALHDADLSASALSLVSSGANGIATRDRAEAQALARVLGPATPPVMAVKASMGDACDTSGLLQCIAALSAMHTGATIPIAQLEEPAISGLRYATDELPLDGGHVLVTTASPTGAASALVMEVPHAA